MEDLIGAIAVVLGFPSVLVSGPTELVTLLLQTTGGGRHNRLGPPGWQWIFRGYLNSLGLLLFVADVGGTVVSVPRLRAEGSGRRVDTDLTALSVSLLLYVRIGSVRAHHVLPTFPLLALLLATALVRLNERNSAIARPLIALPFLTSGTYAGVAILGTPSNHRTRPQRGWRRTHRKTQRRRSTLVFLSVRRFHMECVLVIRPVHGGQPRADHRDVRNINQRIYYPALVMATRLSWVTRLDWAVS